MQSVVITGVSTGIGYAAAKLFLAEGFKVFGSVRRDEDAKRLAQQFGKNFVPLLFDITDEDKIKLAAQQVQQELRGHTLSCLINNAGINVPSPLIHQSIADFRFQMEVNLIGPLLVIQAFAPLLGVDPKLTGNPGKIINVSSVCGKMGVPFYGAYVSSKHALEGMSETLRRELMIYGIDVIVVGPGYVKTEIKEKGKKIDLSPYATSDYYKAILTFKDHALSEKNKILQPEQIAQLLFNIYKNKKPKTRYAPIAQKIVYGLIPSILPKRLLDKVMAKKFKLLPEFANTNDK